MASTRDLLLSAAFALAVAVSPAGAETIDQALASAYANNPQLNAARAGVRATDESVPQALGNYRPTIAANVNAGKSWTKGDSSSLFTGTRRGVETNVNSLSTGLTIVQPLFRGFRTENGVAAAEASVRAARENLRNTEQNVLYSAATAYMDVIQAGSILSLRQSNVEFLQEQVRAARDRLDVGEGTRTDVAQADAALAAATAQVSLAKANLQAARATLPAGHRPRSEGPQGRQGCRDADPEVAGYRDVDLPQGAPGDPRHGPQRRCRRLQRQGRRRRAAADAESAGQRQPLLDRPGQRASDDASIGLQLNIPIYEGGVVYSQVREAKETLGQLRIVTDQTRDQVQANLIAAWGTLEAARAQSSAAGAQVEAAQLALQGVIEEQKVGQRTTLDVLNAQQDVITARITQITAQRDSVVAAYAILSNMGRLTRDRLSLKTAAYKPEKHYKQVRDKWIGLRTPDGR